MTGRDVIIGVGSSHGDDQIGWRLIERLREDSPAVTATLRTVADPIDIVEQLEGIRRLVIVDACRSGGRLGTITRLNWLDPHICNQHGQSTHRISLIDTLHLAQLLGRLPEQVILYGVEVDQCEPQTDLCPVVSAVLSELARRVVAEILVTKQNDESCRTPHEEIPDA